MGNSKQRNIAWVILIDQLIRQSIKLGLLPLRKCDADMQSIDVNVKVKPSKVVDAQKYLDGFTQLLQFNDKPLIQCLCFFVLSLTSKDVTYVVDAGKGVWMVEAEKLLLPFKRPSMQFFCLFVQFLIC